MWRYQSEPDHWADQQADLHRWYSSQAGQSLMPRITQRLDQMLPSVFGYQGLQIGQLQPEQSLLDRAGLLKRLVLEGDVAANGADLYGEPHQLPLATDSVHLVLLLHTLDFSQHPHQVLREVDRVLSSDGYMVVVGFNPFSTLGLRRLLSLKKLVPWRGHFYSRSRVNDWLSLLSYREVRGHRESFSSQLNPSLKNPFSSIRSRLLSTQNELEPVYIMLVRKHSLPITPTKQLWRPTRQGKVVHAIFAGAKRGTRRESSQTPEK